MNVELRGTAARWISAGAGAANDNARPRRVPTGKRVLIYRPAKSAMTSGRANTRRWVLEFEPQSPPFVEPLMGWAGSTDPLRHVRLSFPSAEAAVAFAERQGLKYELRAPAKTAAAPIEPRKPQPHPMPVVAPWLADLPKIELPEREWSGLPVPETGRSSASAGIAA